MKKILIFCIAVLVLTSCSSIQTKKEAGTQLSNTEKAVALLNCLETGDPPTL